MLKKVIMASNVPIDAKTRLKFKGSYGDSELQKIVSRKMEKDLGFKIPDGTVIEVWTSMLDPTITVFSIKIEKEIEDFEHVDHNRYETYLNIVLDKYICVALPILEDINEVKFAFLGKQNLNYWYQRLAQSAAKQNGLDINKIWIDE